MGFARFLYFCLRKQNTTMTKKLLFLVLFMATAMLGQAQVSKMIGQWNTYDDKTGDLRSTVKIYEEKGTYEAVITTLYEKDASGKFKVMKAPYAKEFEGVVITASYVPFSS